MHHILPSAILLTFICWLVATSPIDLQTEANADLIDVCNLLILVRAQLQQLRLLETYSISTAD